MLNIFNKIRNRFIPVQPKRIEIAGVKIGKGCPKFIIAEIGINHNGNVDLAKRMIDKAAEAGVQAVKFQKRTVDKVYTPEELVKPRVVDRNVLENAINRGVLFEEAVDRLRKSDFKNSTNGDLKRALEFTEEEFRDIFTYTKNKGLICFASPWDEDSVDLLERLDVPCYKVASPSITDEALLKKIKNTKKPVILSTGMSTIYEIKKAVALLETADLILLHTVSTYPAKYEDLNLKLIPVLHKMFPHLLVGYSGHEPGIIASVAASVLGASVIERHFTLDKKMFGSDQTASIEPEELRQLVKEIRLVEVTHGRGSKTVLEAEIPIREKLRRK